MHREIERLIQERDTEGIDNLLGELDEQEFSLITIVDSLLPYLAMESNLRYGNFHAVKMSAFLRRLAVGGVFTKATEKAVAGVVIKELMNRDWIKITAETDIHQTGTVDHPLERMAEEVADGNGHNAFFYAARALKVDRAALYERLLRIGSSSIDNSLGHSISCFFPVITDLLEMHHPASGTALLSLMMYLCRYRRDEPQVSVTEFDRDELLKQCTTGTTIVDIHHMITFYTFSAWEQASWRREEPLPWQTLLDWVGNKGKKHPLLDLTKQGSQQAAPTSYDEFKTVFDRRDLESTAKATLSLIDHSFEQACDWLFRVYAEYYTPGWDPHYYTGLYAALQLARPGFRITEQASRLAVLQALAYFTEDL